MLSLLQHSERFVWDFWYHYDIEESMFHLLYLNADPSLVPKNQHHFSARIGYATTRDFTSIEWVNDDVFHASKDGWDNTAIWTGDVIRIKDGFLLFYTSRDRNIDDGLTQNIGAAFSTDFLHWERVKNFRLQPDSRYYEPRTVDGDNSIHSWRDPFVFRYDESVYMLLCAKSPEQKVERKGTVGLLRGVDNSLTKWEVLPPIFSPGWFSECEIPQIYRDGARLVLTYSSWAKFDNAPNTDGEGGLQSVTGSSQSLLDADFKDLPRVLLPESSGLYACRVIPELGGDIVGFNIKKGGLQRVNVKTGLKAVNRNFTEFPL